MYSTQRKYLSGKLSGIGKILVVTLQNKLIRQNPAEAEIMFFGRRTRKRPEQIKNFKVLFDPDNTATPAHLSSEGKLLWGNITMVVLSLRKSRLRGTTLTALAGYTGLSEGQVRSCLRIIIDLGGEITLTRKSDQCPKDGTYALHN